MCDKNDLDLCSIFSIDIVNTFPGLRIYQKEPPPCDASRWTIIEIITWIADRASEELPEQMEPGHLPYWNIFKTEFILFLCTNDSKYQRLRSDIMKYGKTTQVDASFLIASTIGKNIGALASGVITPLVVVCVAAVLKLGKESFCNADDVDNLCPYAAC